MKKCLTLFAILFISLSTLGQSKYCLTYADFIGDNWIDCHGLEMVKDVQKAINIKKTEGLKISKYELYSELFLPKSEVKKQDRMLLKKAAFIMHDDTLYVNCSNFIVKKTVLGNYFAKAYPMKDTDLILFRATLSREELYSRHMVLGGAAGALVVHLGLDLFEGKNNTRCYILNMNSETVELVDEKNMLDYLSDSPTLLEQYKKEDSKNNESADLVMDYLKRAELW